VGGLMAMVLAATEPPLVARIVLNDVGPEVDPAGLARIRGYAGKTAPVKSWAEATAQVRSLYGAAWPGLPDSRWEEIVRLSYRANAAGLLEVDADPLISEPLKDWKAVAPAVFARAFLGALFLTGAFAAARLRPAWAGGLGFECGPT